MKKILLCLLLVVGLVLVISSDSRAAVIHDAFYHWKVGGTWVVDQTQSPVTEYNVGNPTGEGDIIEVHEKVTVLEDGTGRFTWGVTNDAFTSGIYSFHVPSVGMSLAHVISNDEPDDWSLSIGTHEGASYFSWQTDVAPLNSGGLPAYFSLVLQTTGWAISPGAVDYLDGEGKRILAFEDGYWVVSHPTPEPASMALLGIGLLGLAGARIRKRKKFKA